MSGFDPIPARMFISDEFNSPGCLADHPTIVTDSPWELIGQCLTGEMDSSRVPAFKFLPRVLRDCAAGRCEEYQGGTEGYQIIVRDGKVRLDTLYVEPPASCEVPLEMFQEVLERWRKFVRRYEAARKAR